MVRTRLFYIMQMKTQQKSGAEFINIDLIIRNDVNQKISKCTYLSQSVESKSNK